ncbi:MAG: PTS galactitol transporter subunit IIC [Anaerolineae bacterium]|jgi:PTS system galactitol-specific IIC component|nr:MAG: PTS galactitol transporter subunit IIC [Anaerolineae bacterium]
MSLNSFLEALNNIFNTFGATVFVPVILIVINLILGNNLKKSIYSGLYAGIGLTGFTWLISQYIPIIVPVVQNMVTVTGIQLPVVDIGWQATSVIAYATQAGMIFLGVGLLFQIVLFLVRWTNVFQPSDLWNNYSYMAWGSMIAVVTGDLWLALAVMLVMNLYSLLFSELLSKRWSTYYNYPNCTIIQLHHVPQTLFAIPMNWILNKLGAYKVKWEPEDLRQRLGFIGDPIVLGVLLGFLLGFLGNINKLGTLGAWGNIVTVAISTSAVMAIFPRVASLFAQAFAPLTEAARKRTVKKGVETQGEEIYIGINDAAGYGESATLISGIILIPLMVLVAAILPGNRTLPLVDLIALPFMVEPIVAVCNGNIFKVIVSAVIWFSAGLYISTVTAPTFTQVYSQFATTPLEPGALVTSFGILSKPIIGTLMFLPALNFKWLGVLFSLVVYFIMYFVFKRNKTKIHEFMEAQALHGSEQG